MDVWYGDDWLFKSYGASWVGLGVMHERSSTVNGPAKEAIAKRTAKDSVAYAKILKEKGWKDSRFGL